MALIPPFFWKRASNTLTLPIVRYRFDIAMDQAFTLPFYAGSLLRGVFGHALRGSCCLTGEKDCKACPLYQTCLYTNIFEPPTREHALQKFSAVPGTFVIEPPPPGQQTLAAGETLSFTMVLWGKALEPLPLIILAWQRACRNGLSKERVVGELESVSVVYREEEDKIWHKNTPTLQSHQQILALPPAPLADSVTLNLTTPQRLQNNGRPLTPDTLNTRALLMNIVRRASLVNDFHPNGTLVIDGRALSLVSDRVDLSKNLHWYDWQRYSCRQGQHMKLGGVLGTLELSGNIEPFLPFLLLGQWLHAGKNTSFGLGQYSIES